MKSINTLNTPYVKEAVSTSGYLIVDIRTPEAYNGWALYGEPRGGHIKGATNFPLEWTHYHFELKNLLTEKGIAP